MSEIGVGSTIWVMDVNRRRYDENGQLIYREHWRPTKIVGETSRSWIGDYYGEKYPKKDGRYLTSEEELDKVVWVHDNRHLIMRKAEKIYDYDLLKQIAELVGYTV